MRVEVLGGLERRRRWSQDDKVRIDVVSFAVRRMAIDGRGYDPLGNGMTMGSGVLVTLSTDSCLVSSSNARSADV